MPNLISRLSTLVWRAKSEKQMTDSCMSFLDNELMSDGPRTKDWNKSTLVLSKFRDPRFHDLHWPVLDLDMPCHLIPSTTEGHFHLVIEHPIPWNEYKKLLTALADAGIIEQGYMKVAKKHGYTAIRRPGVRKGAS